ncbi:hypothetical protein OS493_009481 [Desmophyllum pertusum]|uniref:Uncharacterized protein n=1 Tax=Desmophyllum pertusum TaxID=174260 RepID=A0A9X0CUP1_9CNID|nr:hypothetical protein OS493_009481 [Desmophyllum pertusum]
MKKELGHNAAPTITVHHFFTFLNFVIVLISVASLSFNVYILRREIDSVKADVRPLVAENEKVASQYDGYSVRSREARQIHEPGPDEVEPGPDEVEPGPDEVEPGPNEHNTTAPIHEGEMTPQVHPGPSQAQNNAAKLNCTKDAVGNNICTVVGGSLLGSDAARDEIQRLVDSYISKTYGPALAQLSGKGINDTIRSFIDAHEKKGEGGDEGGTADPAGGGIPSGEMNQTIQQHLGEFALDSLGPMFVPGASAPGDKTPLETFVDDSVSRSLIKYFEDKGDPDGSDLNAKINEVVTSRLKQTSPDVKAIPGPPGPQGIQGPVGTPGTNGSPGIPGASGPAGAAGLPGAAGASGSRALTG